MNGQLFILHEASSLKSLSLIMMMCTTLFDKLGVPADDLFNGKVTAQGAL